MKRLYFLFALIFIMVLSGPVFSQCGITIAPDTLSICAGDSILISVTDTGNLNPFNWSPAAGLSATTGSSVWAKPLSNTTYTVTKLGCSDKDSVVVIVNLLPVVTISGSGSICAGSNATYNAGGGFAGYLWSTGATTQTISVNTQNTYTVTVTDINGCTSSATKSLLVNTTPACSITGSNSTCFGSTVQWCAAAGMNSYIWNTGDTTSCINISTAGTYTVTITGANGCTGSCQKVLNTNALPAASITGDTLVCRFGQASITFTGANGTPPYTFAYKIDNGNVQTIATGTSTAVINPNTSIVGTSAYILISVTDANSCINLQGDTLNLTIKKLPGSKFTGDTSVCQGSIPPVITFTGNNCTPPVTFTYTIDGGAPLTITTAPGDTFITIGVPTNVPGTYSYNLIEVSDTNCSNTQNKFVTINVNTLPVASITGSDTVCQFAPAPLITFVCDSGKPPYVVTYTINGGAPLTDTVGGSSISIGASTANTGTYTYHLISVIDANGCSQGITGSATITVDSLPVASISGSTSVCKNSAPPYITFTGTTGKNPFTFTYIINGVTNSVTSAPGEDTVNIPVPTTIAGTFIYYLVSVTDASGCANAINNQSATIVVNQLPSATINGTTGVCINGLLPAITFTGAGGLQDYSFTYNINGGGNQTISTSGSDTVTITVPTGVTGIYNYNLIDVSDANGCAQTITGTATVTVNPLPAATISGNISVCQNDPLPLVTFNGIVGTAPFSFTYSINDGINPPDTNTVTSNGTDSTKAITVPTNLAGSFTYQLLSVQDANGCITALNTSVVIIVNQLPSAMISGSTTVCKNDSAPLITFTGTAGVKPFQFIYNIGGGTNDSITVYTASDTSITVSTSQAGTFVYNLIAVQDSNGCIQNINNQSAIITINSLPAVTISGTTSVCHNSPIQPVITFTGASGTQPFTFVYNINGGPNDTITTSVNNIATVVALTSTAGIYAYNLVSVTDANGCSQTQTGLATVTVNPLPSATISGTNTVCQNAVSDSIKFSGSNGTPPYSFTYNINNGSNATITANGTTISILPPTSNAGTFTYNLVAVTDGNGCTDSVAGSATIIVNPLPVGSVAVSQDSICQNDIALPIITITGSVGSSPYTFTYNVNGGSSIIKSTSAGNDTVQIQVPTNVPPGIYNYNLTSVTDANGCSLGQSATIPVTINPLPVIQSSLPPVVLCQGDTIFVEAFTSTVLNSIYNWSSTADVGFGTSGTGNIPNAPLINNDSVPLIATITVYATSPFGCIGPSATFSITVNPKPILLSVDDTICSGQVFNNTLIPNFYNNIKYAWNSSVNPLIITGNSNQSASSNAVINDSLINHTTSIQSLPYSVSLIYTNGTHSCITTDTLNVTVKPAPPKPNFTSSVFPGNPVITLCKGSININFNVSNPDTAVTYTWIAGPPAGVNFGNTLTPNTVASFDAGAVTPVTIFAIADYAVNTGACQDTASMIVNLISSANAIDPRVIFKKEPGHLLIYPDNSLDVDSGYQWGYDSLSYQNNFNDTLTGPPIEIAGQVYQFFIPSSQFISNDSLNEHDYAYWVLLGNGECRSKVYYNGPYANKPIQEQTSGNTVELNVYPNPVAGDLKILLQGNIYGKIEARIFNALGETVFEAGFQKKQSEVTQLINVSEIPGGIYFLELNSSDHQRITTRIIIYH